MTYKEFLAKRGISSPRTGKQKDTKSPDTPAPPKRRGKTKAKTDETDPPDTE